MLKTFAVIGDPIDHSLSPTIHNAAYRELGLECTYIAYKIPLFGKLFKPIISFYTRKVIQQDTVIMKNQGDCLRSDFKTTFRSTEADEVHKEIERLRHYGVKGDSKLMTYESKKEISFWI